MKNIQKTILFASLIAAMILPFSMMDVSVASNENTNEKAKAPDMADYLSQYEDIYKKIRDNNKSIDEDNKKLKDTSSTLSEKDIKTIEKRIEDKKSENIKLFEKADEIERLNIESYMLDDETQAIFDDALETLTTNYLDTNGVYYIFPDTKHRKIVVVVDPDDFDGSYAGDIDAFITELKDAVKVDVEIIFDETVLTHSTSFKKILKDRKAGDPLACPHFEHVLVLRSSGAWACVYFETARYLNWDTVLYSEPDAPEITTSVFYRNQYHPITYQATEGLVHSVDASYARDAYDVYLKISIIPTQKGDMMLTIPSAESDIFENYCGWNEDHPNSRYFIYLVDLMEIKWEEIDTNPVSTTVKLPYDSDSELIEIALACYV